MRDLITIYNKEISAVPINMLTEDTILMTSIMQLAVSDVNLRFNNACQELVTALRSSDMSEAMEQVGVALTATYDNARIMIDMFNFIVEETNENLIRGNDEQERHLGTSTEST